MSSNDETQENEILTPEFIKNEASLVVNNLLPLKSREKYLKAYDNFSKWRTSKGVNSFSKSVFLVYFQELSNILQPSTLWSIYSMLKATIRTKHDLQINTYTKLTTFLKRFSEGHQPKKSKVLTTNDIETFLNTAPDYSFLLMKVVLIFGLNGACRGNELLTLTVDNVQTHSDDMILVVLPDTKTKRERTFVIKGEHKKIVEKYQALRPSAFNNNRFFVQYRNGQCVRQVIGKNKISTIPAGIARFLNLENPKMYTGHCFRRSSATILADSGADLTLIKRHGGWKSSAVAEGYIEESLENKSNINTQLTKRIKLRPASPLPGRSSHVQPRSALLLPECSSNVYDQPRPASASPGCAFEKKSRLDSASPVPGCSYTKPRVGSPLPGCSSDTTARPLSPLPGRYSHVQPRSALLLPECSSNVYDQPRPASASLGCAFEKKSRLDSASPVPGCYYTKPRVGSPLPGCSSDTTARPPSPMPGCSSNSTTNTQVNTTKVIARPNKTIHITLQNCTNFTQNF